MYSKHRLWLIINSLENIPSIDNRLLYADTLDSLNRNVYNIKFVQIPDLNDVYERNYNELKQLLYQKYLDVIKDTEAGLADLIMQDLMDKYQSQIVDSYTVYISPSNFMIGGENGKPSASKSGAPSRGKVASGMPSLLPTGDSTPPVSTGAPPPPAPPPPPPSGQISPLSRLSKLSESEYKQLKAKGESKLTSEELLELRKYEIDKNRIIYTKGRILDLSIKPSMEVESHKDALSKRLAEIRKRTALRSESRVRIGSKDKMPDLTDIRLISLAEEDELKGLPTEPEIIITYKDLANKIKNNILMVKGSDKFVIRDENNKVIKTVIQINDIKEELGTLYNEIDLFLRNDTVKRVSDSNYLNNRWNKLKTNLNENKIPLWRYNYEMANNLLNNLEPPNNIEEMSGGVYDPYSQILKLIADFNKRVLFDNSFANAKLKLF